MDTNTADRTVVSPDGFLTSVQALQSILDLFGKIVKSQETLTRSARMAGKMLKSDLAGFDKLDILKTGASENSSPGMGIPEESAENLKMIADAVSDGVAGLDWDSLQSEIEGVTSALAPFSRNMGKGLERFFHSVLAPLNSWTIHYSVPAFLNSLASSIGTANAAVAAFRVNAQWLVKSFLKHMAAWTGKTAAAGLSEVAGGLQDINMILGEITGALGNVTKAVDVAAVSVNLLAGAVGALSGAMFAIPMEMVKTAVNGVAQGFLFLKGVCDAFQAFWLGFWETLKTVSVSAANVFVQFWNGTVQGIESLWVGMGTLFSNVWNGMKNAFGTGIGWMQAAWSEVAGWFPKSWESTWKGIGNLFIGVWNGIVSGFEAGVNWIIGGINHIVKGLNTLLDFGGGLLKKVGWNVEFQVGTIPKVSFGRIPKLAQGAVIPPNREFLAVLGDQRGGRNLEAPEGVIRQIVAEELSRLDFQPQVNITAKGGMGELIRMLKLQLDKENQRVGVRLATGGGRY